jgi:ureidoglycolate lyase
MRACEDGDALVPKPLTAAAFAAFGTVIAAPAGRGHWINEGTAERFELLADLQLTRDGGRPVLSLSRASARSFPFTLREMERHALGSQSFVPLGVRRFVVVVAAAGSVPEAGDLQAFITDGQQGVCLAPGTWHHGLLAVDAGDYVVVERRGDVIDNDTCLLDEPRQLQLPPK